MSGIPLQSSNEKPTVTKVDDQYCVMTPNIDRSHVAVLWIDMEIMQDLFAALGTALQAEYRPAKVESDQMKMWR